MGEKYDAVKELFDKNDAHVTIDTAKKQETQKLVRESRQNDSAAPPVHRWQIIKMQVFHMDKTIMIIHLAACIGTVLLGRCQHWGQISMIVSGALGALSLLEVGNMFYSKMTELGESCYFNVRQLAAFQMAYSGLLSLAALLVTAAFSGLQAGIYILVPFVFTECVCMAVMLTENGRRNLLLFVAAGVFSALFWSVLSSVPRLYEASALAFWGAALIAGIGLWAMQIRRFFRALDKGEILCAD